MSEILTQIQRLPQAVVDSIAAGEVIERPANLVKELVENSVDAGATEIEVDLDQGGRWLKVSDNGTGIREAELALALERHATSKIRAFDDLWALSTFGFRGEALASAASISRMFITSRPSDTNAAHRLKNEFGQRSGIDEVAGSPGTVIQIEDLFSNVPARLKFLKTDSAELSQVKKVLKAMALVRPNVTFRVRVKGELLHFWPATADHRARAESILEKKPLYFVNHELKGMRAEISFAAPDKGTRTGQNIWLFAQDRWIQDKALFAAVMDAYRSLLMHGEFPIAVVRIYCDPSEIDVNVHPTKSQVKFRDAHGAYQLVQQALRKALEEAPWAPHTEKRTPAPIWEEQTHLASFDEPSSQAVFKQKASFGQTTLGSEPRLERHVETRPPINLRDLKNAAEMRTQVAQPSAEMRTQVAQPSAAYEIKPFWANLQVLSQANLTYILAQSRQSLLIVDQHAAHERIAYEKLMKMWRGEHAEVQPYLLPLTLYFQPDEIEALLLQKDEFEKLKLTIEQAGPTAINVRSAPAILKDSGIQSALTKVAAEILSSGGSFAFERVLSDLCATMACHSVIRAGQALSVEEMKSLLVQMDEFPLSGYCPHGRPVYFEYPFAQMDRQFGRTL